MDSEATQPVCYVTTRGRVSGRDHAIEIWYVEQDGCLYLLSGNGDRADWVRNLKAHPVATVVIAANGREGQRSAPAAYVATLGPLPDEMPVREAIEARYRGWQPGQPLSPWAAESLMVRLRPADRPEARDRGHVFDEVPELYDRVRPGYPDELFADLAGIAGLRAGSAVLEVGCGTGQATRSLAARGYAITAVERGEAMAAVARRRVAALDNVEIETSAFESWDDRARRFDAVVAAASWHWVDPTVGWQRAHDVLREGGWMALMGNVVVRRPGEPEVYAETADLHEQWCPGNPDWGHPPLESEIRAEDSGWGTVADPGPLFGPTVVRWYPTVQWLDGKGFADLLRSASVYRRLDAAIREPLLDAVAERIRTRMGDRAPRRYLCGLWVGQKAG